ncbi:hypothetical protein MPSEU_000569000 [Mayamaea pseudoterrestris]|nr:hypothetical protein MPSEU_000569000 [Mayamaea pseudoterrestris]
MRSFWRKVIFFSIYASLQYNIEIESLLLLPTSRSLASKPNPEQFSCLTERLRQRPYSNQLILHARPAHYWEGDDIRWSRKLTRRLRQIVFFSGKNSPTRTTLIALHSFIFIYQVFVSVNYFRIKFPKYWPSGALEIIFDAILGSARPGPLTLDFGLEPDGLAKYVQPHRYLTSGFLHGGILHLVANIDALQGLPAWLETGIGIPLYLTTFLLSMVAGNVGAHVMNYDTASSFCLGASGGISGLYGLLFVSLSRMGNRQALTWVGRGMGMLLLYGFLFKSVNNAAHVVGFMCGAVIAILFGPTYRKSYSQRRKGSVAADPVSKDYRLAMGFGTLPKSGLIPLAVLWVMVLGSMLSVAQLRSIPAIILQGFLRPGSISRVI